MEETCRMTASDYTLRIFKLSCVFVHCNKTKKCNVTDEILSQDLKHCNLKKYTS